MLARAVLKIIICGSETPLSTNLKIDYAGSFCKTGKKKKLKNPGRRKFVPPIGRLVKFPFF